MWSRIRILSDLEPADWNRIKICIHLNQVKDKLNFFQKFQFSVKTTENYETYETYEKDKNLTSIAVK
jgi:hypothetical protein